MIGRALFSARGWVPVPLVCLLIAVAQGPGRWVLPGLLLIGLGEALRLWAVAHIGPRSRTRSGEVAGFVYTGPYAWCRNPLYLANLLLFGGTAVLTGRPWAPPLVLGLLGMHYSLIVRWEEENLAKSLGDPYRAWYHRTPRWWPRPPRDRAQRAGNWRVALRSERSTLVAIASVCAAVLLVPLGRL